MHVDLDKRIAIVTGSAQGIGKACAVALAENGASVVISDIDEEKGKLAASELGRGAVFIPCDIRDGTQVQQLINETADRFGKLDIMVNNAGVNARPTERLTIDNYLDETWHRIIDADLNGTFFCCRSAAAQMAKQGSGSIVNISSVAGVVALRLQIAFCAAKAGILKMTEAMATELGPKGVRVNAVSPGSTMTEENLRAFSKENGELTELAGRIASFIPQRRLGYCNEIANAVVFLASDSASYVNGHNLVVDGGWTCGFNRDF